VRRAIYSILVRNWCMMIQRADRYGNKWSVTDNASMSFRQNFTIYEPKSRRFRSKENVNFEDYAHCTRLFVTNAEPVLPHDKLHRVLFCTQLPRVSVGY
jgi:hypothetical protein